MGFKRHYALNKSMAPKSLVGQSNPDRRIGRYSTIQPYEERRKARLERLSFLTFSPSWIHCFILNCSYDFSYLFIYSVLEANILYIVPKSTLFIYYLGKQNQKMPRTNPQGRSIKNQISHKTDRSTPWRTRKKF